ncbi:hypothetical protein PMAYCL1PPCAC_19481, partial [Pristionchus mayeri]
RLVATMKIVLLLPLLVLFGCAYAAPDRREVGSKEAEANEFADFDSTERDVQSTEKRAVKNLERNFLECVRVNKCDAQPLSLQEECLEKCGTTATDSSSEGKYKIVVKRFQGLEPEHCLGISGVPFVIFSPHLSLFCFGVAKLVQKLG